MTVLQKVLAALAAIALVFALTLSKERAAQAEYARIRAEEAATASPADIVTAFRDLAYTQRRPVDAVGEFVAPEAVSHLANGRAGIMSVGDHLAAQGWAEESGPTSELKRVIIQGEYVVVLHHVRRGRSGDSAVVNIYRVTGPRIAEVWEVEAAIPQAVSNPEQVF
ncbi:MAG: nuclear transport factor 2 family protein [Pirellulales bacterium]